MNTANLQLAGVYAAMTALLTALRAKGLLTAGEIDRALAEAEAVLAADPKRPTEVSHANVEAMLFPLRYLREANAAGADGRTVAFTQLATKVGQTKTDD